MRRRRCWVGLVSLALVLAACGPVFQPIDPAYQGQVLTRDQNDTYSLSLRHGAVTIAAAATNTGRNTRKAFYPTGQSPRADEQSCATWSAQSRTVQQGAALRVATTNGTTRAVTVTKNLWYYTFWQFNIHLWDTSRPGVFTQLATFDLSSVFLKSGQLVALPWDLCARVIGDQLSFEAWIDGQTRPAWGDTAHGGSVSLPAGWDYRGNAGWYIGHLQPGDTATFTHLMAGAPTPSNAETSGGAPHPVRASSRVAHPGQAATVRADLPVTFSEHPAPSSSQSWLIDQG